MSCYLANELASKITALGGHLNEPASLQQVNELETRLNVKLPATLVKFLILHNGSKKPSENGLWDFWMCNKITTYKNYFNEKRFTVHSDTIPCDQSCFSINNHENIELPTDSLILFCDSMIEIPIYAIMLQIGHDYDGFVFELATASFSASSFDDWVKKFISSVNGTIPWK